ncbi:uncharacterized protein LOC126788051 [Argentina anserina]|uniref:uncharacterized protein LOC126788051 n=1 Tax=Argentina anserina TaxID=57926 RepID=UPI002176927A|nr:uncharacterized protein LOC126788051 [Potentilla anserina]
MLRFKKLCILLNFFLTTSVRHVVSATIRDEQNFYTPLSPINQMIICKSEKPYHRCETLNISHSSCSSYASPKLLSTGFTSNSLLLYNCSNSKPPSSPLVHTLTCLHTTGASSKIEELKGISSTSCFLLDDLRKLVMELNPSDLNCSCYSRVNRKSASANYEEHDLGARIAFEVPDRVPNICNECQKVNGNCGAALRCICHPKECKNKVTSKGGQSVKSFGNYILVSLLPVVVFMVMVMN